VAAREGKNVTDADRFRLLGCKLRAGLLATPLESGEEGESQLLTLEDEYGLVEVRTAAGVGDPPGQGPLVLVEGMVEDNHGVPVVVDARVRRPLPGDGEQNGRVGEHRLRLVR
jgi:hypothetical protein